MSTQSAVVKRIKFDQANLVFGHDSGRHCSSKFRHSFSTSWSTYEIQDITRHKSLQYVVPLVEQLDKGANGSRIKSYNNLEQD